MYQKIDWSFYELTYISLSSFKLRWILVYSGISLWMSLLWNYFKIIHPFILIIKVKYMLIMENLEDIRGNIHHLKITNLWIFFFLSFLKNQFEIILYSVTCFFLTWCLILVTVITCTFFLCRSQDPILNGFIVFHYINGIIIHLIVSLLFWYLNCSLCFPF